MKCLPSPFLSLAPLPLFSTLLLFQYAFNMFMVTSTPVNVGQLTFKRAWVRGDDFLLLINCSHMGGKRYSLQFLVDGPCELAHTLVCELIVPIRWVSREENVNFFEGTFSEKLKKKKRCRVLPPTPWLGQLLLWSSSGAFLGNNSLSPSPSYIIQHRMYVNADIESVLSQMQIFACSDIV